MTEPQTLLITKADLDKDNVYIKSNGIDFDGHIMIEEKLGWVIFKAGLKASLSITAKAGTGIKAGDGIEAGWGIKAGTGIKAGDGIEAGTGIEAGWGISSKTLSVNLRIFAGTCIYKIPTENEMKIKAKVLKGTVAFGLLEYPVE